MDSSPSFSALCEIKAFVPKGVPRRTLQRRADIFWLSTIHSAGPVRVAWLECRIKYDITRSVQPRLQGTKFSFLSFVDDSGFQGVSLDIPKHRQKWESFWHGNAL